MMDKIDFDNLSNSEIRIKLKTLEEEYEVKKNNIAALLEEMEELDKVYDKGKTILNKRTKGKLL
jgi:hypothetical protein